MRSHMCDKAKDRVAKQLKTQIRSIQHPKNEKEEYKAILLYNSMVLGIHQYYAIATHINLDCGDIAYPLKIAFKNRLRQRLKKKCKGKPINVHGEVLKHYSQSSEMRYVGKSAILPFSYVQTRNAQHKRKSINKYTAEGRQEIHKSLGVNMKILHLLMRNPILNQSIEYADNRISLYSAQNGKCAVTGRILEYHEIHCHHKLPKKLGGKDEYKNLVILHVDIHRLVHAKSPELIDEYLRNGNLDKAMLSKLNNLRKIAGNNPI